MSRRPLEILLGELAEPGRLEGSGVFTIDAGADPAHLRLARPGRYPLLLLMAAVEGGASHFRAVREAGGLSFSWDGAPLCERSLKALLFSERPAARVLALALANARLADPRPVRVESNPGGRLTLKGSEAEFRAAQFGTAWWSVRVLLQRSPFDLSRLPRELELLRDEGHQAPLELDIAGETVQAALDNPCGLWSKLLGPTRLALRSRQQALRQRRAPGPFTAAVGLLSRPRGPTRMQIWANGVPLEETTIPGLMPGGLVLVNAQGLALDVTCQRVVEDDFLSELRGHLVEELIYLLRHHGARLARSSAWSFFRQAGGPLPGDGRLARLVGERLLPELAETWPQDESLASHCAPLIRQYLREVPPERQRLPRKVANLSWVERVGGNPVSLRYLRTQLRRHGRLLFTRPGTTLPDPHPGMPPLLRLTEGDERLLARYLGPHLHQPTVDDPLFLHLSDPVSLPSGGKAGFTAVGWQGQSHFQPRFPAELWVRGQVLPMPPPYPPGLRVVAPQVPSRGELAECLPGLYRRLAQRARPQDLVAFRDGFLEVMGALRTDPRPLPELPPALAAVPWNNRTLGELWGLAERCERVAFSAQDRPGLWQAGPAEAARLERCLGVGRVVAVEDLTLPESGRHWLARIELDHPEATGWLAICDWDLEPTRQARLQLAAGRRQEAMEVWCELGFGPLAGELRTPLVSPFRVGSNHRDWRRVVDHLESAGLDLSAQLCARLDQLGAGHLDRAVDFLWRVLEHRLTRDADFDLSDHALVEAPLFPCLGGPAVGWGRIASQLRHGGDVHVRTLSDPGPPDPQALLLLCREDREWLWLRLLAHRGWRPPPRPGRLPSPTEQT